MHQGARKGPVAFSRLQQLVQTQQLETHDLVWSPIKNAWLSAKEIEGLFPTGVKTPSSQNAGPWKLKTLVDGWSKFTRGRSRRWWQATGLLAASMVAVVAMALVLSKQRPVADDASAKAAPKQPELSSEEIVAQAEKAVALIEHPLGHGSGFLVGPGILATNAHVIELAAKDNLKVYFPSAGENGKKPLLVDWIIHFDRQRDLALLEIKTDLPVLKLAKDFQFKRGSSVILIGNPGLGRGLFKLENAVAKGIASSEATLPMGRFYQLGIAANPGNSGGPIFDATGQVIAVLQSKAVHEESIALAIPVDDLAKAVEAASARTLEKAKLTSQCNARAVFLRAAKAAKIFNYGTAYLEKPWQEAATRFGNVIPADLTPSRNTFLSLLKNKNQEHLLELRDVEKAITAVGVDPHLPETTRQRIADLWQVCDQLRLDFYSPVGNLPQYRDRCDKNALRLEELTGSLRVTLGVDQEELAVESLLLK